MRVSICALICLLGAVNGDIYMHNMRGSNNRLNEASATRTNANRLFDSQNNNRGGYNVGDKTDEKAGNNQDNQYRMKFYQSDKYLVKDGVKGQSEIQIEWTNQHGCGGNEDTDPHKQNCNVVIQALCQDEGLVAPDDGITLRDGSNTGTQNYDQQNENSNSAQFKGKRNANVAANKGLQEPWFWYDDCARRERNKGLFTATQDLAEDEAISTRQNPNANRYGYECPEERDYFPYWHPTPFLDVAVLAQNDSMCDYYRAHSANRAPKSRCVENFATGGGVKHFSKYNNQADCTANGGTWTQFYSMLELAPAYTTQALCEADHGDGHSYKWGKPWDPAKIDDHQAITDTCFVQPEPIECRAADWSRSNHLGNGRDGVPLNYTWILPHFPSGNAKSCVFRMRYNISTDDYDPYNTDSNSNGDDSPIQQNPLVDVGANAQPLRLAINTAQTGRTFQDRSHVFRIVPRDGDITADDHIINMNVRGKRGNIVQTYPAVEYDFIPNRFKLKANTDVLHVQWTGSNSHNNGAPGGDGQTGDAGEGTAGTDRHNMMESLHSDTNYPVPKEAFTMFKNAQVVQSYNGDITLTQNNLELILASAGYYECIEGCTKSVDDLAQLSNVLNNAPASFEGLALRFTASGEYYFICTRNNNFTNRSQKGHIIIE